MTRTRIALIIGAVTLVAAGAGVGTGLAMPGPTAPTTAPNATGSGYSGYTVMMGGTGAPQWMMGGALPGWTMTGGTGDPGKTMGNWLANAPGARISAADAARLGEQTPAGATIDRTRRRIVFTTTAVHLTALAGPPGGPDETFRIAGLVNPTLVVPVGAQVSIQVVNADPDTAHGLVITAPNAASAWMPMMTAPIAFPGAAVWALGDPTPAGLHTATLTFTASTAGNYDYLCAVPGHAQKGMAGSFLVQGTR